MREIKFRGRAISDSCGEPVNKMVYGDITQGWDKVTIFDWSDGDFYEVDPDSVAQLVGYDADGAEVYEGDTVRHFTGELVKVRLSGETDTYSYLGVAGEKFDDCRLEKE